MKFTGILKQLILNEISDVAKKKAFDKFKQETKDSDETIMELIGDFEKFQAVLDPSKRDLFAYSYNELKNTINPLSFNKKVEKIYDAYKKYYAKKGGDELKQIPNKDIKDNIRKFFEIQSELPQERQDIKKYDYFKLDKLIREVYQTLLIKKMLPKFMSEVPNLTQDIVMYYLQYYIRNYDSLPEKLEGIDTMSFSKLEHLLDGMEGKKGVNKELDQSEEFSSIDMKYNQNGLKIFAPKTKDQCMRLRNGRSWCTSRPGATNLYYTYRLTHGRTLYYVIDEDLDYNDVNFALVILVDRNGGMALADKTNIGRYSGHSNIPWEEIVEKQPKLMGLKSIFKPEPLTDEEEKTIKKLESVRIGPDTNPMDVFGDESMVEMWIEVRPGDVKETHYKFLTPKLKKKYIAMEMDLTPEMIKNSEPDVLEYYVSKKIDTLKEKPLDRLTSEDIALLNLPILKKIKQELKPKFAQTFNFSEGNVIKIDLDSGNVGKFASLYGIENLIDDIQNPENVTIINIFSRNGSMIEIPKTISKFINLDSLQLTNCIREIPSEICELKNITIISLMENAELTSIPECIADLPYLTFLSLKKSTNVEVPQKIKDKSDEVGPNLFDFNL